MAANLLYLAVLLSGSAFCAAWFGKKTESTVGITAMLMVLVLFILALANLLSCGTVLILLFTVALYCATICRVIKKRSWRSFRNNFFTVGLAVFVGAFIFLLLLDYGRVASEWDEFSHWMDVVKAMVTVDDLNTNPVAHSRFQSYPPAMALFQYFFQELKHLLSPDVAFVEWRAYFSYQIFFVAALMPLFNTVTFRRPIQLLLRCSIIFLTPVIFFPNLYGSVYIDPVLGILAGGGATQVFLCKEKNWTYHLHIWLICGMLVLLKDAGLMFGLFLALMYCGDLLGRKTTEQTFSMKKRLVFAAAALLVPILCKLAWSAEIAISGAQVDFSGKIDLGNFLQVLLGNDQSYRQTVFSKFLNEFSTLAIPMGTVQVNYALLWLLYGLGGYLLWQLYKNKHGATKGQAWIVILVFVQCTAYSVGVMLMYMYKFWDYEAVRLASYTRYLNTVFLVNWLFLLLLGAELAGAAISKAKVHETLLLMGILMLVPMQGLYDIVKGDRIYARNLRAQYEVLSGQIAATCDNDDSIQVISQGDSGFDYWVLRFNARPNVVSGSWSIGNPCYDGDIYTLNITAEEWKAMLLSQYDYVAVYRINEDFIQRYAQLFANPDAIAENRLYQVNKSTGLLELCSSR